MYDDLTTGIEDLDVSLIFLAWMYYIYLHINVKFYDIKKGLLLKIVFCFVLDNFRLKICK